MKLSEMVKEILAVIDIYHFVHGETEATLRAVEAGEYDDEFETIAPEMDEKGNIIPPAPAPVADPAPVTPPANEEV